MDPFSYISVILSIVLGLAIAQVLLGFRGLILTRAKVKLYAPTIIWAFFALLIPIQAWWADFAMRKQTNWTFLALFVIMLVMSGSTSFWPLQRLYFSSFILHFYSAGCERTPNF